MRMVPGRRQAFDAADGAVGRPVGRLGALDCRVLRPEVDGVHVDLARQLVQYERKLLCDSPEGRLVCDEIAPATEMGAAIERVVAGLTTSGAVSAVGNRRAFRVGEEPLDLFRRYCAVYAREQAYCHFSPALVANLERYWDAQNRKG